MMKHSLLITLFAAGMNLLGQNFLLIPDVNDGDSGVEQEISS